MVRVLFHKDSSLVLRVHVTGNVQISNGGKFRESYATFNHIMKRLDLRREDFK